MTIKDTLAERQSTHGKFEDHAIVSQKLKYVLHSRDSWSGLDSIQQEALDMICHKMARIIAGNPDHPDHWHDISGYATLVEEALHNAPV